MVHLIGSFLLYPMPLALNNRCASEVCAVRAGVRVHIDSRNERANGVKTASDEITGLVNGQIRKLREKFPVSLLDPVSVQRPPKTALCEGVDKIIEVFISEPIREWVRGRYAFLQRTGWPFGE